MIQFARWKDAQMREYNLYFCWVIFQGWRKNMELCSLLVGSLHYFAGLMADWPGRFLGQKMTIGKWGGWPANPYIAAKGVPSFCNMSYSYHLALKGNVPCFRKIEQRREWVKGSRYMSRGYESEEDFITHYSHSWIKYMRRAAPSYPLTHLSFVKYS